MGLYRDIYCHQDDVFYGKLLDQGNARSHSVCATTAWFRRDRVNVLDWPADLSPIENVWLIMKRRIRQQQSQTAEHLKSCIKRDWTKMAAIKIKICSYLQNTFTLVSENFGNLFFSLLNRTTFAATPLSH
uniref:Tc1-like transposase DDE domain-containing protein n=1 Tax=Sinocyclocheilus anshuiensis TaxID=1608454 RepID=A0A671KRL5_9TELE